ncbi:nuclear pore complex protein Nup160-like isoform X3 [Artemia franciscana]
MLQRNNGEGNVSVLHFLSATQLNDRANNHVYRTQPSGNAPRHADSYLSPLEDAYFTIALGSSVQLIKLGKVGQVPVFCELSYGSLVGRIWGGLMPGALRSGKSAASFVDTVQIVSFSNDDVLIFGLTHDIKLHVWNAVTHEYKGVYELEKKDYAIGQNVHKMASWVDPEDMNNLIVSLSLHDSKEFQVYEIAYIGGVFTFSFKFAIQTAKKNLVNFSCGVSDLFALFEENGRHEVAHVSLVSGNAVWVQDDVWQQRVTYLAIDQLDPLEVYLSDILKPYNYSEESIFRALTDFNLKYRLDIVKGTMKEMVVEVIQNRFNQLLEVNLEADVVDVWKEFRELCISNESNITWPLSIFSSIDSGLILLLRRNAVGVMRRKDDLEVLFSLEAISEFGNLEVAEVQAVFEVKLLLNDIRQFLADRQNSFFQELLEGRTEPFEVAAEVANRLHGEHGMVTTVTSRFLSNISSINTGFQVIAQLLTPSIDDTGCVPNEKLVSSFSQSLAERCFSQMTEFCYELCRDLLVLIEVLNMRRKFVGLQSRDEIAINATIKAAFSQHTLAFWLMKWLCETPSSNLQAMVKHIHAKKLPLVKEVAEIYNFSGTENSKNLTDLYLMSYGSKMAALNIRRDYSLDVTIDVLLQAIGRSIIAQLLAQPVKLLIALISSCEYVALQTYIHYAEKQSTNGNQSDLAYKFLAIYLCGEPEKACDLFIEGFKKKVFREVFQEDFCDESMGGEEDQEARNTQHLDYIMKVISIFEGDNLHECVTDLATLALESCDPHPALASTLWCKLFWSCLALGQNAEAYSALELNPDKSQTSDLLRSFLFDLLERGNAKELLNYSYSGMESCIFEYMLSRARSLPIGEAKDYYNFLYSLNITKNNPKQASIVMYEQAYRLKTETEANSRSLNQRVQCLLSTMTCLELVHASNAWVERPDIRKGILGHDRNVEDEEFTVEVYELSDLKKEYDLTVAQLSLLQLMERQALNPNVPSSAQETVAQLVNVKSYELAISVARRFDIKTTIVIDALTSDYVNLLRSLKNDFTAESETLHFIRLNNPSVREIVSSRPVEQVERLLEASLVAAERSLETVCHRTCAFRILSSDVFLPAWLVKSYSLRNWPELVSLYHQLGFLEEASRLAVEKYSELVRSLEKIAFKHQEEYIPPSRLRVLDKLLMELKYQVTTDSYWSKALSDMERVKSNYLKAVRNADVSVFGL